MTFSGPGTVWSSGTVAWHPTVMLEGRLVATGPEGFEDEEDALAAAQAAWRDDTWKDWRRQTAGDRPNAG